MEILKDKKIIILSCTIILFFVGLIIALKCTAKSQQLYPINNSRGGGYINKKGEIIIKQQYNFAGKFVGNYATVECKNKKEGIINKKGNIVIACNYDNLEGLNEGFVIYSKDEKYGFIDISKKHELPAIYEDIKPFHQKLAAAKRYNKWGFIDKKGKFIIDSKYDNVGNFSENLASVRLENKTAFINKGGEIVIPFRKDTLEPRDFSEGLVPVLQEGNNCSYMNSKGEIVIDSKKIYPIAAYCGNFYNGVTVVYVESDSNSEVTTGYMNKKGKLVHSKTFTLPEGLLKEEFSVFGDFSSNMAMYSINWNDGFINKRFKEVIPPVLEFARNFEGDLAYVKYKDREGYINKKGKWVWAKERTGM